MAQELISSEAGSPQVKEAEPLKQAVGPACTEVWTPPDHVCVNHGQPPCDPIVLFRRCGESGDGRLVQVAAVLHELQRLFPSLGRLLHLLCINCALARSLRSPSQLVLLNLFLVLSTALRMSTASRNSTLRQLLLLRGMPGRAAFLNQGLTAGGNWCLPITILWLV